MTKFDPQKQVIDAQIERVNNFIKNKKIGKDLTNKLRVFLQKNFSKSHNSEQFSVINMFPSQIKREIVSTVYKDLIQSFSSFFSFDVPGLVGEIFLI